MCPYKPRIRSKLDLLFLATAHGQSRNRSQPNDLVMVNFNSNEASVIGQISLMVSTKPYKVLTNFAITNTSSHHNIIMGRPWLHKLRACPSTHHQCFDTQHLNRAREIRANPGQSRKADVISASRFGQKKDLRGTRIRNIIEQKATRPGCPEILSSKRRPDPDCRKPQLYDGDVDYSKPRLETADGEEDYKEP